MEFQISETNGVLGIALAGRFTYADHARFRPVLDRLDQVEVRSCVVDLSRLEAIDSSGLGMLVLANDVAIRKGFVLRLSNARGGVRTLLTHAEFGRIMTVE
ncbi:MAG: STAS domain-containing protein [Azospirillum sp.]|nr:STAS domain-containing protein [Azospirillum sp.]